MEKKKKELTDFDREVIKGIAAKAKQMRIEMGFSYEAFAIHAKINRNTYFKFEKSSITGDNFTIAVLVKVIHGLNQTFESFFQNL
jgi:DNA-binding XRE family transcriptional regulator